MMVHVEHTAIADGAMMASVRFKHVTHQAVSFSLRFRVTHLKAPIRRNLSRLTETAPKEAEKKQRKDRMKPNHTCRT
jgi:hypothetical protein